MEFLKAKFPKQIAELPEHKTMEDKFQRIGFYEQKQLLEGTIRTVPAHLDVLPASSASGTLKTDMKESLVGEGSTQQPGVPVKQDALLGPQQQQNRIHVGRMEPGAQDHLQNFLCDQNIEVVHIEWVVDRKHGRNRLRYAYVDLLNSDSLEKAIDLGKILEQQTEKIHGLGKLRIEKAKPKPPAGNSCSSGSKSETGLAGAQFIPEGNL